jgi:hypothetical protein
MAVRVSTLLGTRRRAKQEDFVNEHGLQQDGSPDFSPRWDAFLGEGGRALQTPREKSGLASYEHDSCHTEVPST